MTSREKTKKKIKRDVLIGDEGGMKGKIKRRKRSTNVGGGLKGELKGETREGNRETISKRAD